LEDARGVFDKLNVNKTVFSWIIMMGGYAKRNHTKEAMELFDQM
jgi:pentatricopeptide repeat protein